MRKNEKGITLIVLIITIIVLLILAGVTVSGVLKKDGAISNAKRSAATTAVADAKEEVERAVNELVAQNVIDMSGPELAMLIDAKLKEFAREGSHLQDVTYVYNYDLENEEEPLEEDLHNFLPSPAEGDVEEGEEKKVQGEMPEKKAAEYAMVEMAAVAAEPRPEPLFDRYRYFEIRYKGELKYIGTLNMNTGDFEFNEAKLEIVSKDEVKVETLERSERVQEVR